MTPSPLPKPYGSLLAAVLLAGASLCALMCWSAYRANGGFGFPLDDSWIHLQFARNLNEYGSFSYYRNEMVTSGSTSPLYTALAAVGFLVTSNEMVLSYVLGLAFFVAGALVFSRIGAGLFKEQPLTVIIAVVLFMLEPRLQWVSLSGMETTLFILMLLVVWYTYRLQRPVGLGVAAGLLLWTRPEAILFFAVLAVDVAYQTLWVRRAPVRKRTHAVEGPDYRWLGRAVLIAGVLCVGYVGFNLALSGSVLPNTYAAKTRYYGSGHEEFTADMFRFLTGGHMPVLAFLAAIGMIEVIRRVFMRAQQGYLIPLLWSAGLSVAYWQKLPFLYQQGRYLMPILPFVILLGMCGIEVLITLGKAAVPVMQRRGASMAARGFVFLVLGVQFGIAAWQKRSVYAEECRYITDRQVRVARWIRDSLPEDAVIGTHDIGALAFCSGRRVVDMVGLVSPEMIENIGSFDRLTGFLARKRVTHLAILRNWFEIVNQNPMFQTDERKPEIMEVFQFNPSRGHFTPQNATRLTASGGYYLARGDVQRAGALLEQSLRIDPRSSRTRTYFGLALLAVGKDGEAEREIKAALDLHPDFWQAKMALAEVFVKRNKPDEALALYEDVREKTPDYSPVYQGLWQLYLAVWHDTASATAYRVRYEQLAGRDAQ